MAVFEREGESAPRARARVAGPGGAIALRMLSAEPRHPEDALPALRQTFEHLPGDGLVLLWADFAPTSIVRCLQQDGWRAGGLVRAPHAGWSLEVWRDPALKLLDLLDLEAPEPMERVLEASARLSVGEALAARTPCYPRPLLVLLERRGLLWSVCERADGSGLVHVRRPA